MSDSTPLKVIIDDRIVPLTPILLAQQFAAMDCQEQALFFSAAAMQDEKWNNMGWPMQLQYITDEPLLTNRARRFMALIGEYSHKEDK